MSQFTWTYDAPLNVYKSHAMSDKLRMAAVASAEFAAHVRPESGFGKNKGETVTITRIANIPEPAGDGTIPEQGKVPIDTFSVSTTSITVKEMGRGIEYTSLQQDLAKYDLDSPIQRKLKDQMHLIIDTLAATQFKAAKIKFVPLSLTGGQFDEGGAATATALSNLTYKHMGVIRDYMRENKHVPFYENSMYVAILSTKAARGVKDDPQFEELTKYLRPADLVYKSEIGKAEQFRVVENNHVAALSSSLASGVLGEGVFFGEDAVSMAEAITPELRAALAADFGRQKAIAWYGILAYGIIWDTAVDGQARIVHLTSA